MATRTTVAAQLAMINSNGGGRAKANKINVQRIQTLNMVRMSCPVQFTACVYVSLPGTVLFFYCLPFHSFYGMDLQGKRKLSVANREREATICFL